MEVFIDNKRYSLSDKNVSFSVALEEINQFLKRQDKVLLSLYVNGEEIDENDLLKSKDIKLIEVSTKTHREIIIESLYYLEEYIENFFNFTNELLDSNEDFIDTEKIETILTFTVWTYGLLVTIKENTALDLSYFDFDEFLADFKGALDSIKKAYENDDIETVLDVLEFELSEYMADLERNVEAYSEEVLNEEVRKNLLN